MRWLRLLIVLLPALIATGSASKILGFFGTPSKSHLIIHMAVVKPLLERGHDVTVVSTLPIDYSHPKLRHVLLNVPDLAKEMIQEMIQKPKGLFSGMGDVLKAASLMFSYANETLSLPETKAFLNDPTNEFDLAIIGSFFNDYHLGIGAHFNCPIILSWMVQPIYYVNKMVGNPLELSYVPVVFSNELQPMNFISRVKNFAIGHFEAAAFYLLQRYMEKYYNIHFPPEKYRSFDETLRNVSLVFVAHHSSLGPIRPNVPGIIEIGGIHIDQKPNPLPKDLQAFMDDGKEHGVVYFCMGSNVPASALPKATIDAIFNVFKSLKQKVVMKWEGDEIPIKANNIYYSKWLPQRDILSHPNVRLFITHGGYGGTIEAKHRGVPIIGIPVFADQMSNVRKAEAEGWGLLLDLKTFTEDDLRKALQEIIGNTSYRDNVQRYSTLYNDRITTPQETAAFWAEYVIRHRGAKHLQSPAVHMNAFQYYSLDVIGFLVACIYVVFKVSVYILKLLYRLVFKRNTSTKLKKN